MHPLDATSASPAQRPKNRAEPRACGHSREPIPPDSEPEAERNAGSASNAAGDGGGRARSDQAGFQPSWGKPAVRNDKRGWRKRGQDLLAICHDARKGRNKGSHWSKPVAPPLHSTSSTARKCPVTVQSRNRPSRATDSNSDKTPGCVSCLQTPGALIGVPIGCDPDGADERLRVIQNLRRACDQRERIALRSNHPSRNDQAAPHFFCEVMRAYTSSQGEPTPGWR